MTFLPFPDTTLRPFKSLWLLFPILTVPGIASGDYCLRPNECAGWMMGEIEITGSDRNLCKRLLESKFAYIKFTQEHAITYEDSHKYAMGTTPSRIDRSGNASKFAEKIDINNDGQPENILPLKLYSGAAAGCDREYYVEIDDKGKAIIRSKLSELLDVGVCGDYVHAFSFEGSTYLARRRRQCIRQPCTEIRDAHEVTQQILMIKESELNSVCEYHLKNKRVKSVRILIKKKRDGGIIF